METQRHLLMTGYDDELHKREHEYRMKLDEMSNRLLEKDLKVISSSPAEDQGKG